ncbi:MAG: papain-like cysteine protease family protein [Pseudomonadota bacterium]
MKRRQLLLSSAALAASWSAPALARTACSPYYPNGMQQCESGIDSAMAYISPQGNSQWCWAACIQMIFRYYGYNVPQHRIVAETWGGIVNMPAQPRQILANLNREWRDDNGRRFGASADMSTANPITAAQDLAQNQPLVIGTMGHAMVLTSLVYARAPNGGGEVVSATVRDPWQDRGRRTLSAQEWYQTSFLARVRVG